MEKQNSYLSNGKIEYEFFNRDSNNLSAYESFILFIKNCQISFDSNKIYVFKTEVIEALLETLYSSIDEIHDENKVETNVFLVKSKIAIDILKLQRKFLVNIINYYSSFKKRKKGDTIEISNNIEGFINYMPSNRKLSSGENALLNLFSRLHYFLTTKLSSETRFLEVTDNYILLLDEADLGFHPVWKRKFVNTIVKTIPYFFNELDTKPNIQIIFTTHDPLTLSDLPNNNIIYLFKDVRSNENQLLDLNNPYRPRKSFAANITDLLADSFFVEDGLIGDFAKEKIQKTIDWLYDLSRNKKTRRNESLLKEKSYHRKIINIIDEPILKYKLDKLYYIIFPEEMDKEKAKKQIEDIAYRSGIKINFDKS